MDNTVVLQDIFMDTLHHSLPGESANVWTFICSAA